MGTRITKMMPSSPKVQEGKRCPELVEGRFFINILLCDFIDQAGTLSQTIAHNGPQKVQRVDKSLIGKMIGDSGASADSLYQAPLAHHFEMSRRSRLIQPEFVSEFGYIERLLAERIEHEDAVGVRECETKIGLELGDFLFESLVEHVVLAYIHINAYLHPHHTFVTVCTTVLGVILICV